MTWLHNGFSLLKRAHGTFSGNTWLSSFKVDAIVAVTSKSTKKIVVYNRDINDIALILSTLTMDDPLKNLCVLHSQKISHELHIQAQYYVVVQCMKTNQ